MNCSFQLLLPWEPEVATDADFLFIEHALREEDELDKILSSYRGQALFSVGCSMLAGFKLDTKAAIKKTLNVVAARGGALAVSRAGFSAELVAAACALGLEKLFVVPNQTAESTSVSELVEGTLTLVVFGSKGEQVETVSQLEKLCAEDPTVERRRNRFLEMQEELQAAKLAADERGAKEPLQRHFEAGERFLRLAASSWYFLERYQSESHAQFYSLLSSLQVECDYILEPEVDPEEGWVQYFNNEDGEEDTREIICDTQLLRLYLDATKSGALRELSYKPRKCNLIAESEEDFISIGHTGDVTDSSVLSLVRNYTDITRYTQDLLSVRFVSAFDAGDGAVEHVASEVVTRAGFGGHGPNANTGFSIELTLLPREEQQLNKTALTVVLPLSVNPKQDTMALLRSVGGVDDEVRALQSGVVDGSQEEVFGLRFHLKAYGLTVDWRSAIRLSRLEYTLIEARGLLLVRLSYPAEKLAGDIPQQALFCSIY